MRKSHLFARASICQPLMKPAMPRIYNANTRSPIGKILIPPAAFPEILQQEDFDTRFQ
jgi:hypothetical protein